MEDQNIVICISCGAPYKQGELNCPFCQTENRTEALRRKREKLDTYDEEAKKIRENTVPNFLSKVTKIVVRVVGVLLIGLAVAAVVAAIAGPIVAKWQQAHREKHLAAMEELLQGRNYQGLADYEYEQDIKYDMEYRKYKQVIEAYKSLDRLRFGHENMMQEWTHINEEQLAADRMEWAENIAEVVVYGMPAIRMHGSDKVVLGNEAYLEELYQDMCQELYDLKLTQEQVGELSREWQDDVQKQLVQKYSKIIYENMFP